MHILRRNRKNVYYSLYTGRTAVIDSNGLRTGEYNETYTDPVKVKMSVAISSGANNLGSQGMAELKPYGITTGYTHRFTTDDMNCPIEEQSLIWYGITPGQTYDEVKHNFKVVRKAVSLNYIIYYVKEVDVA